MVNCKFPLRIINSQAPIRVCDNGGWTDTWFAEHGKIFNIGVQPCAHVQIQVFNRIDQADQIILHAENFGDRYAVDPKREGWDRHPLLEAAIRRIADRVPDDIAIEINIFSPAPAGASTGTSAAVSVALVGALDRLIGRHLSPQEAAYAAHSIEVDMLKRQSGIQDQLCSAHGGINFIEMDKYPRATVTPIHIADSMELELDRRLVLIYLGKSHDSSQVHLQVIRELENAGPNCQPLKDLRSTAAQSRDAVLAGDLAALGRAMIENTKAQARLNPALVSRDAQRVIEIVRAHDAAGWKVNGAGGEGGSMTILCSPRSSIQRAMIRAIEQENSLYKNIPISLSRLGLHVWESNLNHEEHKVKK